jgi:hypothetical protein
MFTEIIPVYISLISTVWAAYSALYTSVTIQLLMHTEHRGQVVNTPALYSGGPRFKYLHRDQLFLLRFLWFCSVPPGKCQGSTLNYAMTPSFHILSSSSFIYHPFI